jgi:hypothetical protein
MQIWKCIGDANKFKFGCTVHLICIYILDVMWKCMVTHKAFVLNMNRNCATKAESLIEPRIRCYFAILNFKPNTTVFTVKCTSSVMQIVHILVLFSPSLAWSEEPIYHSVDSLTIPLAVKNSICEQNSPPDRHFRFSRAKTTHATCVSRRTNHGRALSWRGVKSIVKKISTVRFHGRHPRASKPQNSTDLATNRPLAGTWGATPSWGRCLRPLIVIEAFCRTISAS